MPEWRIERAAAAADLDAIMAVEDACFTNPWTRAMYEAEFQKADGSRFVLARDSTGRVVGFCAFWHVLDELHVNNLAVLPTCRRQGIGSALLEAALADARSLGVGRAFLEVRASNEEARRLYLQHGFHVAGVRRGYYSKPDEDAVVLVHDRLADGGA